MSCPRSHREPVFTRLRWAITVTHVQQLLHFSYQIKTKDLCPGLTNKHNVEHVRAGKRRKALGLLQIPDGFAEAGKSFLKLFLSFRSLQGGKWHCNF